MFKAITITVSLAFCVGFAFTSAASAQAPAPGGIAAQITAEKSKPGSEAWDTAIEKILLATFDQDKSGEIDSEAEIGAIPCEVWQALDKSLRTGGDKDANLIKSYGIAPKGDWDGDEIGIAEKVRAPAVARVEACGLLVK